MLSAVFQDGSDEWLKVLLACCELISVGALLQHRCVIPSVMQIRATADDISSLSSTGLSVSFEEKFAVFFPRLMWFSGAREMTYLALVRVPEP